jgi:hypothetical protein
MRRIAIPISALRLAVGDFNGDADLDVVAQEHRGLGFSSSPMVILFGNGDGTFATPTDDDIIAGPAYSASLAAADLNNDGVLDLVNTELAPNHGLESGSLNVFLGNGDGTFQPPARYGDYLWGYFRVIAADVNADGYRDLVASASDYTFSGLFSGGVSGGLAVVLNNGDGTFGDLAIYDHAGSQIAGIAAADFDGDGLIDILTANGNDNTFSILFAGPQLASPLRAASVGAGKELSADESMIERLPDLVEAALLRLAEPGFSALDLERLRRVTWRVADLGEDLIGLTAGNVITIDDDAAGWGWFVDTTPLENEEFAPTAVDRVFEALGDGPAEGRMDLFTALLHEMGHVLGESDLDPFLHDDDPMSATLPAGIRRLNRVGD